MKKLPLVLLLLWAAACSKKAAPAPAAVPAFSTARTVIETKEPVAMVNTSSGAVSYAWQTDDGQTAATATPSFSFATVGTHKITLTARNAAGSPATVDHTVTVGERYFTAFEVVSLPFYSANGPNLRVDFKPASLSVARFLNTPVRGNVQPQMLPLTYTQILNYVGDLLALKGSQVVRTSWLFVLQNVSAGSTTPLQSFTLDLRAPSANRDQAGSGWYELVDAAGNYRLNVHYETRIR